MTNYFHSNLKKLSQTITQKQIAQDTKMSPASITKYINKISEPSIAFLTQLKNAYGINIDDFLFKDLNLTDTQINLNTELARFVGNFIIYYYDTSPYKGSTNIFTKNALNYGIVSILNESSNSHNNSLVAHAQFLLNRKDAEESIEILNSFKNSSDIKKYYSNLSDKYEGTLKPNPSHIFLNLKNSNKNDECFMILNNPPSGKSYIGGIATVNSIARGREHMPCIQYSILSKQVLNVTDGEIYNLLSLGMPDINIDLEIDHLIKMFKTLYINSSDTTLNLTEYQKKRIIEDTVKTKLEELIDFNTFRFAKISDMEDDKYYRIIKEEMLNE